MSGFHGYEDRAALRVGNLQRANRKNIASGTGKMCFVSLMVLPPQLEADMKLEKELLFLTPLSSCEM